MVNDATYRSEGVWRHRLSLFGEPSLLYDEGIWTQSPAMSQYQDVAFPSPWGNIRCYIVGLETVTIPQSFDGLRHASFWRGFSDAATTEVLDPAPFMWDMESRGVRFKLEDSGNGRS